MGDLFIVGIGGGSGAGKTTLTAKIGEALGGRAAVLCHDYYYQSFSDMALEERKLQNYDHPASFETSLLIEHLKALRRGETIRYPVYSYTEYTRTGETVALAPPRVLIVEGILIFENRELTDLFDLRIFLDAAADNRFIRRMLRDIAERGRTVESVVAQYMATVRPMHEKYVEPSKRVANVIIPSDDYNPPAHDMVVGHIQNLVAGC